MMGDVFFDCTSKFCDAAQGPAAKAVHRKVRKKRSTILSQEALVGVKWKWKRGLRFCHPLTF
jgi:hypothetical protein